MPRSRPPITLALNDDNHIVVIGVAHMFDQYTDRIEVVELDSTTELEEPVDIALYDAFAQPSTGHADFARLARGTKAAKVVVYTWNFHRQLIEDALANGAAGYLSKALPARRLVEAIEQIHAGTVVVSAAPGSSRLTVGLDWPGRSEGLSERESEVLALIVQGHSNTDICEQMCLSVNTIKTYIRSAYRKIDVTNRVEAVLWGVEHGFRPDHHRIDQWMPEPMIDLDVLEPAD
jgi:DNA-binding NarL/FixJ family response regulator